MNVDRPNPRSAPVLSFIEIRCPYCHEQVSEEIEEHLEDCEVLGRAI